MLTSRSGSASQVATSASPSIEDIRRRARHRLIGAAVLVALGVLGFPLLFDTQPRPIAVDIPIEIPARDAVVSEAPVSPVVTESPPASPVAVSPTVSTQDSLAEQEEVVAATKPQRDVTPAETSADKPFARRSDVSGSPAKLLPRPAAGASAGGVAAAAPAVARESVAAPAAGAAPAVRTIVQVGAFADAARAQEVRWRLERAGLKTYTHVAETAEGKRIRVRLGPFSDRAEAEKAAERAKALGLPAALLTL